MAGEEELVVTTQGPQGADPAMPTEEQITRLCRAALDAEDDWRALGPDGRRAAYERFQRLLHAVADLTARPYEEVMNEAIEEWIRLHFCSMAGSR